MATKFKLSEKDIKTILENNPDIKGTGNDPWWVLVLKVIAYVAGLLLAGYATPSAIGSITTGAASLFNIF